MHDTSKDKVPCPPTSLSPSPPLPLSLSMCLLSYKSRYAILKRTFFVRPSWVWVNPRVPSCPEPKLVSWARRPRRPPRARPGAAEACHTAGPRKAGGPPICSMFFRVWRVPPLPRGGLVLASRWVPRNWCLRGQALRHKDVLSRCRARWEEDKRTQIQLIRVFEALAPAEPAWAWACRGFWGSGMMCMVMQRICQAPAEPAWTCRGFLRLWHQRAWSLRGFLRLLLSLHGYAEGF